jgi:hypothetical protein
MSAGVKQNVRTLLRALVEERPFTLVQGLRFCNLSSLATIRVKNSVRHSHLFDHLLRSRLLLFELPSLKGAGCPIIRR